MVRNNFKLNFERNITKKTFKNNFINSIMTTCSICYEKFTEEYENMIKNSNGYVVRSDLDIGISHECETKNCECIICHKCEMQIIDQMNDKDTFKCPMCRQYQWKYHFDVMVLGMDLLIDWRDKKKREQSKWRKILWQI